MTELGQAILIAMAGQGWTLMHRAEGMAAITPAGRIVFIRSRFLTDPELEGNLRLVLLGLMVAEGLMWPWPPDHDPQVHGEIPNYDW